MKKKALTPKERRAKAKRMGFVSYLLMLVGLAAVVIFAVRTVSDLVSGDDTRKEYESFISPIVMMDPIPFEDINDADPSFVLEAAVWSALAGSNRENYRYDDMGLLLLPSSDVDVAAAKLFGPDVRLEHMSFEDLDGTYLYDPEITAYRIPVISKLAYSPSVTEIKTEGEKTLLTVGYIAPGNMWTTAVLDDDGDPEPEKYMEYELALNGESYYVKAVRDIDDGIPPRS